eukprot:4494315-Pyramimonas_sp.AAC.1
MVQHTSRNSKPMWAKRCDDEGLNPSPLGPVEAFRLLVARGLARRHSGASEAAPAARARRRRRTTL